MSLSQIEFNEFCDMMYALTPKAAAGGLMDCTAALVQSQEALEAAKTAVDSNPADAAAVAALGQAFTDLVDAEADMKLYAVGRDAAAKGYQEQAMAMLEQGNETADAAKILAPELYSRLYSPEGYARCG